MPESVHVVGRSRAAHKHRQAWNKIGAPLVSYKEAEMVDICSKPCDHYRQARSALIDGKYVLVEKPPCGTLAELDELRELGDDPAIWVVNQYRHLDIHPSRLRYQRWIRDADYYDGWRGDIDQALGGVLMSHGIHFIDWYIHRHGQPSEVRVHQANFRQGGIETFIDISLDGFFMAFEVITNEKFAHHNVPNPGYGDMLTGVHPLATLHSYRPVIWAIEEAYAQIR